MSGTREELKSTRDENRKMDQIIKRRRKPLGVVKTIEGPTGFSAEIAQYFRKGGSVTRLPTGYAQYPIKHYEFDGWHGGTRAVSDDAQMGDVNEVEETE